MVKFSYAVFFYFFLFHEFSSTEKHTKYFPLESHQLRHAKIRLAELMLMFLTAFHIK